MTMAETIYLKCGSGPISFLISGYFSGGEDRIVIEVSMHYRVRCYAALKVTYRGSSSSERREGVACTPIRSHFGTPEHPWRMQNCPSKLNCLVGVNVHSSGLVAISEIT